MAVALVLRDHLPLLDEQAPAVQRYPCLLFPDAAEEHRNAEPVIGSAVAWPQRGAR